MLMKKIAEDHYIMVQDSEIKGGDWYYLPRTNFVYQCKEDPTELNLERQYGVAKITHSTQPLDKSLFFTDRVWGCERLSLGEVKELIDVVDVEKKGEKKYPKSEFWVGSNPSRLYDETAKERRCYIEGYKEALEDNKDKKYTETDIKNAIIRAYSMMGNTIDVGYFNEVIQSLQPKTEWEVEFIEGKLKLKE